MNLSFLLILKKFGLRTQNSTYIKQIVNVIADKSIVTDDKIDPMKLRPITYDGVSYGYYVLGERVGNAFLDGAVLK